MSSSNPFDPTQWTTVDGFDDLTDITYHRHKDAGIVRIAFDRPEVRNAFRPHTVDELYRTLDHARRTPDVGCVLLTGNGPSPKDGGCQGKRGIRKDPLLFLCSKNVQSGTYVFA